MAFQYRSFLYGVITGACTFAILKWLHARKKKYLIVDESDDCLLFLPFIHHHEDSRHINCGLFCCSIYNYRKFLALIENTRYSLDICVYLITSDELTQLILKLFRRGIYVRIIIDKQMSAEARSSKAHLFIKQHIPIKILEGKFELMHNKFVIIDQTKVITGSFNWTRQGMTDNFENAIVTHNKKIVQKYGAYFQHIWYNIGTFS